MNEKIQERLTEIFTLCTRINLETDLACWCDMSGHVDKMYIKLTSSKDKCLDNIHRAELKYQPFIYEWQSEEDQEKQRQKFMEEFNSEVDKILSELTKLLTSNWTTQYTVWVNTHEMSHSQPFIDEEAAKKYLRKMKRKYSKVTGAMFGINEETVER